MWPNPQETADLVTFTEEILNGKLSFLCSEEVRILHGDNFGGQLTFYEVLFVNCWYGLYKLKYLKIRFSIYVYMCIYIYIYIYIYKYIYIYIYLYIEKLKSQKARCFRVNIK